MQQGNDGKTKKSFGGGKPASETPRMQGNASVLKIAKFMRRT